MFRFMIRVAIGLYELKIRSSMLFGAAYGSLLLMLGAVLLVKRKGRSRSDSRGASRSGSEGGASRSEGGQTLEMGIEALSSGMVSK